MANNLNGISGNFTNFVAQAQLLVGEHNKFAEENKDLSGKISELGALLHEARNESAELRERVVHLVASEAAVTAKNAELEVANKSLQDQLAAAQQKWMTLKELFFSTESSGKVVEEKDFNGGVQPNAKKRKDEESDAANPHKDHEPAVEKRSRPLTPEDWKRELHEKLHQLSGNPTNAHLLGEVGHAYYKLSDYKNALDHLRKSHEQGATDWKTQHYIGLSYYYLNQNLEAEYFINESLKLNKENAYGYTARCKIFIRKKEKQAALADLTQAEKLGESRSVVADLKLRIEKLI